MTLCDAGPLVALVDEGETENHARCTAVLNQVRMPLLTTWPCFSEAMYLLHRNLGYPGQDALWQMHSSRHLVIQESDVTAQERMRALMAWYRDIPMDLADASLVAAAETRKITRVFTLDPHFYAYRTINGRAFEVIP